MRGANKMKEKMTIIVFSGDMDKVMASFILATSAAAEGMDVTMFFTFWGLNVMKRNEGRIQSPGFMRKMLNWMNRGGSRRLPLSKFDMLGMGRWMMKKLMKESKMPTVDELITMAKEMGVKLVACTTTMGVMGLSKDTFIPEVDSFAGASAYLGEAKEGRVNLFI
jgi:peroxiredoxin family protein